MIITRAPLRISFVGGGTDLSVFYTKERGHVLSAAIDKYVYVTIKHGPEIRGINVRYSESETVRHVRELKNDRVREALLASGIDDHIEISIFSDFPGKTGLGSSSSFSVALMKGLRLLRGDTVSARTVAEDACTLEIEVLKEPIGKQDHYAAAMGGFNMLTFNPDHSVEVDPLLLDFHKSVGLEKHALLFFTGITRDARDILSEQQNNTASRFSTLSQMAAMVEPFRIELLVGNFKRLGEMLHEGWELKRTLASGISSSVIDELYAAGRQAGAWGGKVLGAGGGGCILFLAEPAAHETIRSVMKNTAEKHNLEWFSEVPFQFVQSGVEVLMHKQK